MQLPFNQTPKRTFSIISGITDMDKYFVMRHLVEEVTVQITREEIPEKHNIKIGDLYLVSDQELTTEEIEEFKENLATLNDLV